MQRLLGVAGKRKVVYLTAVYTGLRRSEMDALERRDLHVEGEKSFINVRASTTKKTYTDAGLLPVADAVLKLPFLGKREATGTQIGTQNLFRAGHDLSTADMKSMGIASLELPVNQQDRQQKDGSVQTGQNLEMVRGTGFEL